MNDSLSFVKRLEAAGISREQAEVQVSILVDAYQKSVAVNAVNSKLSLETATKLDLLKCRNEIADLQVEVMALKAQLDELRASALR